MITKTWGDVAKEEPIQANGGYLNKFKQGLNKFRILSEPVSGYQYWTADNKPVRSADYPKEISKDIKKGESPKYFWAFAIYNFDSKAIEILVLTQATLITPLQDLVSNPEWGDPTGYSLTVNRKGEGLETEYTITPSPAKPTPKSILDLYKEKNINLEALLTGQDPFKAKEEIQYEKPEEWEPKDETETAFD